jgi:glutamate dehydrogenase
MSASGEAAIITHCAPTGTCLTSWRPPKRCLTSSTPHNALPVAVLEQLLAVEAHTTQACPRSELVSRTRDGRGLTRPEIAVLLAHSKNVVRDELLACEVPDNPIFGAALRSYFPTQFQQRLGADIAAHRLSREIIATQIADDLINHVGPGLIYQLDERLGVPRS